MRTTVGRIAYLSDHARFRLKRLTDLTAGLSMPVTPPKRRLISYVTIEAANLWAQYSMSFYYSIALGARDASGHRIAAVLAATKEDALTLAVHVLHPSLVGTVGPWKNWQTPDWQNKGHLVKLVKSVGPSMLSDVDKAVSYPTRVLYDLPTMRNYYAHKAERAASAALKLRQNYGITGVSAPDELLCTNPTASSDILLNEWLSDLAAILGLMP